MDIVGGYQCHCSAGYSGNGSHCTGYDNNKGVHDLRLVSFLPSDIDECSTESNECHINAKCSNVEGSYACSCDPGFTGDGFNCTSMFIHISNY